GPADIVVEKQGDGQQKRIAVRGNENVREQPPDLPMENARTIKAQGGVEQITGVDHHKDVHNRRTQGDKEHQIGDALVPVAVAEALKVSAQIFQCQSLLTAQAPELKHEWDEAVPMPPLEGSFPSQAAHPKASP